MKRLLIIIVFITVCHASSQAQRLPGWFTIAFRAHGLNTKYSITPFLKPDFLTADFNEDKIPDIAVLITEIRTKKKGVLLMHGKTNQYFVFGAGTNFGYGGDNFGWLKQWSIYTDKIAYETTFDSDDNIKGSKKVKLARNGLLITDLMDGQPNSGGIVYWDGNKYTWIHQGE